MTSSVEWTVARRIGFRFAVIVGALLAFPFPISAVPKIEWLETALLRPVVWATQWFATGVLGLPEPTSESNGSGDRVFNYVELLLIALVAVLGTLAWSVLDRRRRSYPQLASGARVVLRYYVAWAMLWYGMSKILKMQFYDLSPGVLHLRLGEAPPMRLLWAFMGYSLPYTMFAGIMEFVGGVLLLWRRTTTLGALLVIVVMTNVVLLNLCYDVPVKLYSTQLLVMAAVIALPDARRLIGAVLGRAATEVPPRPRTSPRRERARVAAKLVLVALMALGLYLRFAPRPRHDDHGHELYGNWVVDGFVIDGVEHPPLTTDPVRWESWSASSVYARIWLMNGDADGQAEPDKGWDKLKVDAAARTITVVVDDATQRKEVWSYARPAPDRLVIDCVHRGKSLHVALHREPEGGLLTRGFHWINEVPYNL